MKRLRCALALLPVALVLATTVAGARSCSRQLALPIICVSAIAPHDVELDEHIRIKGEGFPSGKPARVTFRGTLRRPGARPKEGAEVVAWGTAVGADEVQVAFDRATEALLCGADDRATHTTFHGDVEVAFAAAVTGAPPIVGSLRGVTLDFRPGLDGAAAERDAKAQQLLAFLGIHVAASAGAPGLEVEQVDPGSRAQAAGIVQGDLLLSFDGVGVTSPSDVATTPGSRQALLGLRTGSPGRQANPSGGESDRVLQISVDGFESTPPDELASSALLIVAALAAALLFTLPLPERAAALLNSAARQIRDRATLYGASGARPNQQPAPPTRTIVAPQTHFGPKLLVDVVALSSLAAMPLSRHSVGKVDVGLLLIAMAVGLAAVEWVASGASHGVARGLRVVLWHVPAALAVGTAVVASGSLQVKEAVAAQGGWPWQWLAFRSPAGLISWAALLVAASAAAAREQPHNPLPRLVAMVQSSPPPNPQRYWIHAVRRAHLVGMSGLSAVLFLGGWSLPGVASTEQDASLPVQMAGSALFLAKVVVVAWLLENAQRSLHWPRPLSGPNWRALGSTALAALLLGTVSVATGAFWAWWNPNSNTQQFVSESLFIVCALATLAVNYRVRCGMRAPDGHDHLSPFL